MKKSAKNRQSNASKKHRKPKTGLPKGSTITEIPVQKVTAKSSSISQKEVLRCSCYRNGFCIIRDDKCLPNYLKCIKNKQTHRNSFAPSGLSQMDSTRKTYRNSNDYNPFTDERYGFNQNIKTLNNDGKPIELYVFKGFLNLLKQYTTDYYVAVKDIKTGRQYKILVAHNSKTNRYYISDTQLKWLHKRNIYPNTVFHACNDGSIPLVTIDFQEFSKLALYGYSAGKNGLSTQDRRKILKHILDNGIMSGYEIIEHLQGLISLREGRTDKDFSAAINNWREDIRFVNDYKVSKR